MESERDFSHVLDDVNPHILRMFEGTFLLDAAQIQASSTLNVVRLCLYFNPFMPSGFFYHNSVDRSVPNKRGFWLVFIITMFYRISCI